MGNKLEFQGQVRDEFTEKSVSIMINGNTIDIQPDGEAKLSIGTDTLQSIFEIVTEYRKVCETLNVEVE